MYIQKKINIFIIIFLLLVICLSASVLSPFLQKHLIGFVEKFLVHRVINHEIWSSKVSYTAELLIAFCSSLLFFKAFSVFFVLNAKNSFIALLRICAALMVFFCHCALYTVHPVTELFKNNYMKVFRLPAGGGVWIFFILAGYLAGKGFAGGGGDKCAFHDFSLNLTKSVAFYHIFSLKITLLLWRTLKYRVRSS